MDEAMERSPIDYESGSDPGAYCHVREATMCHGPLPPVLGQRCGIDVRIKSYRVRGERTIEVVDDIDILPVAFRC